MPLPLTRRSLLQGASALGLARALPARAAPTPKRQAVAVVFFRGGFNALHVTPTTLRGAFTTTADSVVPTGTGVFVDKRTFGQFSASTLARMAVAGVDHGLTAHAPATSAFFTGAASYPLTLAAAMTSDAALRCALLGEVSSASFSPVSGASPTKVGDVRSAIDVLVGSTRPDEAPRASMARGLRPSYAPSKPMIEQNPRTLASHASGYETAISALEKPVRPIDWAGISTAYGLDPSSTQVATNASRFAAAELAIQGSTPVVVIPVNADQSCGEAGWDTHGDMSGECVRGMFSALAVPHLSRFLDRTLAMADCDVTTVIAGEFSRDPELSDHARCLAAAVFGPKVKPGSTGPAFNRSGKLAMPDGTPGIAALWALVAELAQVSTKPFGQNPHASLVAATG